MYGETKNISGNKINNEIDVFEFWNEGADTSKLSKINHMNVHYNGGSCSASYMGNDFSTDFHIFIMIWEKYKIEWYVDGVLKRRYTRYINLNGQEMGCNLSAFTTYIEQLYPQDPMSIILNVAVQHNNGNDPDTTPFPSQMEVDYVRFYQRLPCYNESITIDATTLDIKDGAFNSVVGSAIKMGDGFTLENKQHLMARATNKIVLKSGFTAKSGCNFTAKIDPSACNTNKGIGDEIDEEDTEIIPKRTGQEEMISDINVFPNPVSDRLFVEIPYCYEKIIRYKVQIMNAQGKMLQMLITDEYKISMDMNNYPSGLYLFNIMNIETGAVFNYKIIKQ